MREGKLSKLGIVGVVVFIAALVVTGPIIVIWALNTLFGLGIGYTFKTWVATVIVCAIFQGYRNVKGG